MSPRRTDTRMRAAEAARRLLETGGPEAVTMRAVAAELGLQVSSLYKHYPDKSALEAAVIASGLEDLGRVLEAGTVREANAATLAAAYRRFALAHPHLYRLMHDRPLPRQLLPAGLEESVAAPIVRAFGGRDRARAAWAAAHGLASLELAGRFPDHADLDAAWAELTLAFSASNPAGAREPQCESVNGQSDQIDYRDQDREW